MISYAFYRGASRLASPALSPLLNYRLSRGKEDPERVGERRGEPGRPRPEGPLVWLHGASVGEALALLPVIERTRARFPEATLLLTTGTRTSAEIMGNRLPPGVLHQYIPVDLPGAVTRFFDHWRPDLIVWTESDLWPNHLMEARSRGIPCVLLNGRMSARSWSRWRFGRPLVSPLLEGFALVLGQTRDDTQRLRDLGAKTADCVGNLKHAASPPPFVPEDLARAKDAMGSRPRWILASSHADEELLAASVHRSLKPRVPGLLTLIVPRHANRSGAIKARLEQDGLSVALRSDGWPAPDTDVLLGDTMGEMGLYYRLAPVVVMGKTFPEACARTGGQNPLEPALLDSALLWGPGMENFTEIAAGLEAAGGALRVSDRNDLEDQLAQLLGSRDRTAELAAAAGAWARGERQVIDRIMERLAPFLETACRTPDGNGS
ncbi:3-deoxy-D-manno-octulosonic acid transferase [Phaeovibrio sulfidiphilus]|uniref:3-deoxy-D-manno-octulosonic acid transferase n=1 Tax=Phaeovibrio sulfidiphilus TaxID=1220600 RepID=A0A8J7CWW1_9PROT|nr:3-deoxy-D-manno-octulosonic acid transferase [Phaeovibrio sulfidiphilus]MBE1237981.1 3-deoxy-D-manno-octulosonic acid transferase [Phaeovibrio sulfidiphilus]